MKKHLPSVIFSAVTALAAGNGAFAACEHSGPMICGAGTPQIVSSEGLQVSRGGDFSQLASGSDLKAGDRVLVGGAKATLALGAACHTTVGAGSLVFISPNGAKTCASVTSQKQAAMNADAQPDRTVQPWPGVSPLAVVTGVGVAAAIGVSVALIASHHGNGGTQGTGSTTSTVSSQ